MELIYMEVLDTIKYRYGNKYAAQNMAIPCTGV